ncbi:MAG: hypothetical protein J6U27_03330, partial [Spirochaetales bacterium]|nr:hypothetical protein [Spirochaetales bacterium]
IKVEGDVRIVEIEGVDRIACGGVHVASTGEIGIIYSMGHEQIRGHVRLYFGCGLVALENLIKEDKVVQNLNRIFSCHADELESKVASLSASLTEAKAQLQSSQKQLAKFEISSFCNSDGLCIITCKEGTDLQSYAQCVPDFCDLAMLIFCPDGNRTKWLVALKGKFEKLDFNVLVRPLLSKIDAKGGGKTPVFQGVANCSDKIKLEEFASSFKEAVRL